MRVDAVGKAVADHSGVSLYEVSRRLGRSEAWAGMVSKRPGVQAATLARIAEACGCDLVVVDRETGERVATIDPPERG